MTSFGKTNPSEEEQEHLCEMLMALSLDPAWRTGTKMALFKCLSKFETRPEVRDC